MSLKKKKTIKNFEVEFKIPQIDESFEGLKREKPGFKSSKIGSPMFGTRVKDEMTYPNLKDKIDVRKNYDNFRSKENKLITDEELIAKYGTKYYEFDMISERTRKEVYGDDISKIEKPEETKETKKETPKNEFSFIKSKDEFVSEDSAEEIAPPLVDEETETFSFNLKLDEEEDEFEYSSFEPNVIDTQKAKIPDFLLDEEKPKPSLKQTPEVKIFEEEEKPSKTLIPEEHIEPTVAVEEKIKPIKEVPLIVDPYKNYKYPPKSIFKCTAAKDLEFPAWLEEKKNIINQTLTNFDIAGEVVNYTMGPTLTRYEVLLAPGVNVRKVSNLYETFQMQLGAKTLRIQAPIPGKKTIGIEVPNDKAETVFFGDILSDEFYNDGSPLRVALGKDIDGKSIYKEIDKMPHGLIAGSTGSGKSVCINTILVSLLLRNKPSDLKLILVDPKKVELISYNDLPHLVTPVIDDPQMASEGLKWAVEEMERRYDAFSSNRVRNIKDYNQKALTDISIQKMAYIVIVIDELADLMMVCSNDVEDSIKRLTQKSRAAGIHLLVATQRPTVEVVKGTIKANIPTRIAFRVFSQIDSSTILDEGGAETLLGKGDMLIKEGEVPNRLQGAFISDSEIDAVTDFIRNQSETNYIFTHDDLRKKADTQNFTGGTTSNSESVDTLYQIASYCVSEQTCSINSLQQQFNLGFNRAQRIVLALEDMGIVSPKKGTKGREILITEEELNRLFEKED